MIASVSGTAHHEDAASSGSGDAAPRSIDPAAWLERHGDVLFRYALLRVGDQNQAEDIVQETLLAALRGADRFAGQSQERTWLVGILKHKIVDHHRRKRTAQADVAELPDGGDEASAFNHKGLWQTAPLKWGTSPGQSFDEQEFWDAFSDCLSGLPESYRAPFVLREVDGMDSEEICKLLDLTPTNLWTLLHRARTRLRTCLEKRWFRNR